MIENQHFMRLKKLFLTDKLPHAILLQGNLVANLPLAQALAKWLLCHHKLMPTNCNNSCGSCKLFDNGNHPDYFSIDLDPEVEIKIDHIRSANEFSSSNPYLAKSKVVLINNIHQINLQAANAFLKTLEEPPINNSLVFLLLTNSYKLLPVTILSRVVKFDWADPVEVMKPDLRLQQQIIQDLYNFWITQKLSLSELIIKWQNLPNKQLIDRLWFIIVAIIKRSAEPFLVEIGNKIEPMVAWNLLDSLNYLNKLVILGNKINVQLFWYNFFITSITGDNIYADRARA